jgi:outer membrane protein insertion porin family
MKLVIAAILFVGMVGTIAGQTRSKPTELIFEGNKRVPAFDLINNFKSCAGDAWKTYDSRAFDYYREKCTRKFLWSRGFLKASTHEESARLVGDHYTVIIKVNEGPRYRWGTIAFNDLKPEYLKIFRTWCQCDRGQIADGLRLENFVSDKLREEYADRGYVQYFADLDLVFNEPKDPASDGTADVKVTIEEGMRFTVRRIEFKGVSSLDNERLKTTFPLKTNDVFVQSKLENGIDAINRTHKYQPANKDSDVQILADEEGHSVDLIITLKPPKK